MSKIMPSLLGFATLLALDLSPAPAQAQLSRTFVSAASGNDANNCDRPAPCRTFQGAHDKTNSDGEITVLDPGGYGAVTIKKAISIVNDSVGEASILVSGGAIGILVQAPATAAVNLRGLTVQGIGFGGGFGLTFNTGAALTIENCIIRNHTENGIGFFPTGSSSLAVSNTLVADNGGSGIEIISGGDTATTVKAILDHIRVYGNSKDGILVSGLLSTGTVAATVTDSVVAGNGGNGIRSFSLPGSAATSVTVTRSVAANNRTGLVANGFSNATLRVGRSSLTGNTTTWAVDGGAVLRSYGDNTIDGNGDGDPAPPAIARK